MNHPQGRPHLETRFEISAGHTGTLYLPYDTLRVLIPRGKAATVGQSRDLDFDLPVEVGDGFTYSAVSLASDASPADLRHAPGIATHCPIQIRQYYIDQVGQQIVAPDDRARIDQAVHQVISSLPAHRRTDYDIAEAIRSYVSQRATYSLAVSPVPDDQDAVAYFLFTSRRGYCDLFASAMAVMCRHAGLPARVATGFAPGIRNTQGGFDLRALDKHAWVEVWFPKYGWVEFDPTLGSRADSSVSPGGGESRFFRNLLAVLARLLNIEGPFPYILFILVALGLAYLVKVEVIDRIANRRLQGVGDSEHRSLTVALKVSREAGIRWARGAARERYARMEHLFARAGVERAPSATPLEFQHSLASYFASSGSLPTEASEAIMAAVTVLTEEMMLAAYAPIDLSGPESLEREQSGEGGRALKSLEKLMPLLKQAMKRQRKAQASEV